MTELQELKAGDPAPDFKLLDDKGQNVSLRELQGKPVVLYFYPKDNTPGCTTEACNFRDNMGRISSTGALIYGISPDSVSSHQKFINKFSLSFPLLSDEGAKVATAYGVWKEKNMYGRKYMGIERSTFLIDEQGNLAKIWPKVKPAGHAEEVIKFLEGR